MKKRVIAVVCALATILCVCAAVLTVDVSAATKTFEVGYARVDVNPWEDPYDTNDEIEGKGGMLQLPLRGNGNAMNRQSVPELIDDNGDGEVKTDGSDGLFASCIAVTDDDGDTVLMYSIAIIGGFDRMVDDAREGLIAALKEKNIKVDLPAQNIQIQGTHTHNSIDLTRDLESYKDDNTKYYLQDQNGETSTTEYITRAEVYNNFRVWYPYLIDQLVNAGVQAIQDRATATMYKGEIDAGEAAGKVMNTVRHYTRVSSDTGEVYVRGSNFNGSSSLGSGDHELAEANDTMYCLKFTFSNGNAPIALVNWRAHTTQNDRNGTRLNISSCYVNRMSYELSKSENGGYRSIFIQGAAGNINPSSALYGSWCGSSTHTYEYTVKSDGSISYTGTLSGNVYGEVLGQVAAKCLESNMTAVDAGDIRVTNMVFNGNVKSYEEEIMYHAAKTVDSYGDQSVSYPFIYPINVTEDIYNALSTEQQGWYNSYSGSSSYKTLTASNYSGETYALASRFHVQDIPGNYRDTGTYKIDVTAFMLGEKVAFVTAPGEMYDRYNSNVNWDTLKTKTQEEIYNILSATNEWDKILSTNVGGSYGTPFVMGYANSHIGYMPNYIAYEYSAGSKIAAVGSYEAHCAELDQGENEHILDVFASMLGSLVGEDAPINESGELYKYGYCEACKETVAFEPISSRYNDSATLKGGHYHMVADWNSNQRRITAGETVCLDLEGKALTGKSRAVYLADGEVLNIMDSSSGKTGYLAGLGDNDIHSGDAYYCGSVYVGGGSQVNLYSGNITQLAVENAGTTRGGCVLVKDTAVFNMYGGTIKDGRANYISANNYGGNVYLYGGTFNMYDGTIQDGIAYCPVTATTADGSTTYTRRTGYGGNVCIGSYTDKMDTDSDTSDDVTYYGAFNMYGGTIKNGQVVSDGSTDASGNQGKGYGGDIFVTGGCALNLHGGSITGGTAQSSGNCVYVNSSADLSLSGNGSADQIYMGNRTTDDWITVTGGYSGSAELWLVGKNVEPGNVVGVSDNAVLNTTGLTFANTSYIATVSGDQIVAGTAATCACGESVVINELTQALWDAYEGNLPSAHYKLTEDITVQAAATGIETANHICLDLAGNDISVTSGRLYYLLDGAVVSIYDSSEGQLGTVTTAGLPSTVTSNKYGGLFWVDAGGKLELHGGTLTMAKATGYGVRYGGIVYVKGTFDMTGGTVTGGICDDTSGACYGGNIALQSGGVMNMSGGTVSDGTADNGTTSENAGGNIQILANCQLNMSGGSITGGSAKNTSSGNCVRQSSGGKLKLSGNACVEETSLRTGDITIAGAYTGTVVLRYAKSDANPTLDSGDIFGVSEEADLSGANISVYNYPSLQMYAVGNSLVLAKETTCSGCGQTAAWLPLSCLESVTLPGGHYFVDQQTITYDTYRNIAADSTVCIDLRGNTVETSAARLFNVYGTLHILDTEGGGIAQGVGGTDYSGYGGGTVYVYADAEAYLHSGTLTQKKVEGKGTYKGGVVFNKGTFYMEGGSITGGTAFRNSTDTGTHFGCGGNVYILDGGAFYLRGGQISDGAANGTNAITGYGGNIYIEDGALYLESGSVTGGTATGNGSSIYALAGTNVVLSGDADVNEICFAADSAETFTISGAYTGTATLKLADSVTPEAGMVVGISDSAVLGNATISVADSALTLKLDGDQLVLFAADGSAIIKDSTGVTGIFDTVGAAITAYQGTSETLVLMSDVDETGLTISQNMTIDLNGSTFEKAIAIGEGVTVTCLDSQTGDYDASDDIFTRVPASMADATVAAEGYVKYTHEEDNTVSFHKIDTAVESLSVRPAKAGMYYGGTFKGDEYAAELVESFGVALSITESPVADENGFPSHSLYSSFDGSEFEPGNVEEYTSTILVNILSESNGAVTNRRNGATDVFGVTYIKLKDGTYIYGNRVSYSLQWAMEWTNDNWEKQSETTKQGVFEMYEKYPAVFKSWETDTIQDAYKAAKR